MKNLSVDVVICQCSDLDEFLYVNSSFESVFFLYSLLQVYLIFYILKGSHSTMDR